MKDKVVDPGLYDSRCSLSIIHPRQFQKIVPNHSSCSMEINDDLTGNYFRAASCDMPILLLPFISLYMTSPA